MPARIKIIISLFVTSFLLAAINVTAQKNVSDSTILKNNFSNSISIYYQSLGDQSRLYNGTKYAGYPYKFSEGIPFFLSDKLQEGAVAYDDVEFQNIHLQYDELSGAVIMHDENHTIQLLNEKIAWFIIAGFKFINVNNIGQNNTSLASGFYNILYDGNVSALKKETKKIREILAFSGEEKTYVIDTKINYYLKKNNEYVAINNQKELVDFFHDKKKEMQRFIKTNKLNFKKDPDNTLAKVAEFFDATTK